MEPREQRVVLILADISGYTKFMVENQLSAVHGLTDLFSIAAAVPSPRGQRRARGITVTHWRLDAASRRPIFASRDWHPKKSAHFQEFGGQWPESLRAGHLWRKISSCSASAAGRHHPVQRHGSG